MSAGYGRGYYGNEQLARRRSGGGGGGWFKIAVIVGLGAVIWFMLPGIGPKAKHAAEPEALKPSSPHEAPHEAPQHDDALDQLARSRGFASTKLYEDSVIANVRELEAAGARVVLAPHLQHLERRLEA
jgi:hypothetical protein